MATAFIYLQVTKISSPASCHAYDTSLDSVTLPPELEQFAAATIAAGQFRDVSEVVAAGIGLLRRQDAVRAELLASVIAAEEEGDRLGYLSLEAVEREMEEGWASLCEWTSAAYL